MDLYKVEMNIAVNEIIENKWVIPPNYRSIRKLKPEIREEIIRKWAENRAVGDPGIRNELENLYQRANKGMAYIDTMDPSITEYEITVEKYFDKICDLARKIDWYLSRGGIKATAKTIERVLAAKG